MLLPLSFLQNLHALRWSSLAGIIALSYLAVYLVIATAYQPLAQDIYATKPFVGVIVFFAGNSAALNGHFNSADLYRELQSRTPKKYCYTVALAYFAVTTYNALFGMLGYFYFGDKVSQDILTALPTNTATAVGRLAVAISVASTYPLLFQAMRASLMGLMDKEGKKWMIGTTLGATAAIWAAGCSISQAGMLVTLISGVSGIATAYVFPCLIHIFASSQRGDLTRFKSLVCGIIILIGFLASVATIYWVALNWNSP